MEYFFTALISIFISWKIQIFSGVFQFFSKSFTIMFPRFNLIVFILFYFYFYWRLITLQYCIGFAIHWHESAMGVHVFPILNLPPHPIPQGHPCAPALSTLSHASDLDWWSISQMVIYMFQCYSLKSYHLCLLPQSLRVCSLHLCLFCYLAYRVIVTIFLNSIYMH